MTVSAAPAGRNAPVPPAVFGGALQLAPGAGAGSLRRVRVQGLDRLWQGQPADAWPGRVAAVFSLCGHAHRWTAVRALQAARGTPRAPDAATREALRWSTVREHARRLLLDWPAAWPLGEGHRAHALARLRAAPAEVGDTAACEDRWSRWLVDAVLHRPPGDWLDRASQGGEPWLTGWAESTDTPAARWLAALRPASRDSAGLPSVTLSPVESGQSAARPWGRSRRTRVTGGRLSLSTEPAWLREWSARLAGAAGAAFAERPEGPDGPLETGPWARPGLPAALDAHNAWMRMAGRLVDLVRLVRPEGAALLEHGQVDLGAGTGLAWTGMARGVLMHWVRLDANGPAPDTIAACRIVAPTDWNTHPEGALAQSLAALPADPGAMPAARALALAFDPCVPVQWTVPADQPRAAVMEAGRA